MPNQFCNLSVSLVWPEMLKAADKLRLGLHDSQFILISSWTFMQLLRSFCIELVFQSFKLRPAGGTFRWGRVAFLKAGGNPDLLFVQLNNGVWVCIC